MAGRPRHPHDTNPKAPDRFNEEGATFTVRGADAPDMDLGVSAIAPR